MRALLVWLAALSVPLACLAQAKDETVRQLYEGTLGGSRIGLTIVHRGNTIEGGHYFYQKYLQDIPLSGKMLGGHLTLAEKGAGTFDLYFVGNGSENGHPLDFENSVGMDGTWTSLDGSRHFAVSVRGTTMRGGPEDGHWYADVTAESGAAFEARVQSCYRAILSGDRKTALRLVSYPLRVNGARGNRSYRNAAEVLANWDRIFTPALLARLRNDLPHDMFVHQGMAMMGNGEAWFDAKGLAVVNLP